MVWIVGVLSAFFAVSGLIKVTGRPAALAVRQRERYFRAYGFEPRVMYVVGTLQLLGAVMVWFYDTTVIGFAGPILLIGLTLGAIFFHIRHDRVKHAMPAAVMFVLSLTVLMVTGVRQI